MTTRIVESPRETGADLARWASRTPSIELNRRVGEFFRRARQAQRLSQEQLASLASDAFTGVTRAAISSIERGRHLPGLELLISLTRALHLDPVEVLECVENAHTPRRMLAGLSLDELGRRATDIYLTGDFRGALAVYDLMLNRLETEHPDATDLGHRRSEIEINRASALRRCGALGSSRAAAERAIVLADGYPETQARAYIVIASLLERSGNLPIARDMAERAVSLASAGPPRLQGLAWIEMGMVHMAARSFEAAHDAFHRATPLVAGDRHHEIMVQGNIATCLAGRRRWSAARKRYLRAIEMARSAGEAASEAFWFVELARLDFDRGEHESADDHACRSLRIARSRGDDLTVFRAEWIRHLSHSARRPASEDRRRLARLRKLFVRLRDHRGVLEVQEYVESGNPKRNGRSTP